MTTEKRQKIGAPFHALTEQEARQWYKDKLLTTTGYLFAIKKITIVPSKNLVISNVIEFCEQWNISKSAFYRAVNELKQKGYLDWEATHGVILKDSDKIISLDSEKKCPTRGTDSHDRDEYSQVVDEDSHDRDENSLLRDTSIYIDRARPDITDRTDNTDISPPTPSQEGGESEKTFGFEIPKEEPNRNTQALLTSQMGVSHQSGNPLMMASVPPAPQDPFFGKHRKASDVVWDWLPDGPWKINGKLCPSFVEAIANRYMKEYGHDLHTAKANAQKNLRNEPTNLPIEWEWYQSTYLHKAANVQIRKQAGINTGKDEQEIIKHAAAFNQLPDEMRVTQSQSAIEFIENTVDYATHFIAQGQKHSPQIESVATVDDSVWDSIASDMEDLESCETSIPEGAESVQAYQEVVKRDDAEHFRQLYEKASSQAHTSTKPVRYLGDVKNMISALAVNKGMPKVSREEKQKFKEEDSANRKLLHWNNLLSSGIPSVVADVERQAKAQGYQIIDGRVFDVEF